MKTKALLLVAIICALAAHAFGAELIFTWTDNSTDEKGFTVWRADAGTEEFIAVGNVEANVTTYTDSGLKGETVYRYQVTAWNDYGASTPSNTAEGTTRVDGSAPAAPGAPEVKQPDSYTPPEPVVSLQAGQSLRVVASASN